MANSKVKLILVYLLGALGVISAFSGERCIGSIGDCASVEEFLIDSEMNRRMLLGASYISYSALMRNSVPCSIRGSSYYNCQLQAQGNPYTRGCSAIARCRS